MKWCSRNRIPVANSNDLKVVKVVTYNTRNRVTRKKAAAEDLNVASHWREAVAGIHCQMQNQEGECLLTLLLLSLSTMIQRG